MREGDLIYHVPSGLVGILDEALHDGDAFVTWNDGAFETVKWHQLIKIEKGPSDEAECG